VLRQFARRHRVTLGLDIRPGGVRYVCLRHDRHGLSLLHQDIWQGVPTDEGFFRMAESVRASLDRRRIRPERVIAGLPRQWCYLKVLELPTMDEENLSQALGFELEKHLPVEPDTVQYDQMIVEDLPGPTMTVLVGAVNRDKIEPLLAALRAKDLEPEALVPSPLANGALLLRCQPDVAHARRVMLVEEEEQAAAVDCFEDGLLASTQRFSYGNLVGPDALAYLQRELTGVLSPSSRPSDEPSVVRWFFLGPPESLVRQAMQTLGQESPEPLAYQTAFRAPEGLELERFHTAVGLALYGAEAEAAPMNLIPPPPVEDRAPRRFSRRAVLLGTALAVALGLYGTITIRDHWELRRIKNAVAALRPQVGVVNDLKRELNQVNDEGKAIEVMVLRDPSALELLRELTLLIPTSGWLTEAQLKDHELLIGGYSDSALELIGLLEESPRFANVEFQGTITKRDGKERFKLAADIE
jgi:hypothetical protein